MTQPLQLGIVLPTYNERGNIRGMVQRLDEALAGVAWEVIVVDDNSPDGTADEARAIHHGDSDKRSIHGEATPAEAARLTEEGIEVMPLPFPVTPPEKRN